MLNLCMLGKSHDFCHMLIFFPKHSFKNTNSLDPDQALNFVGSDLGPNCL